MSAEQAPLVTPSPSSGDPHPARLRALTALTTQGQTTESSYGISKALKSKLGMRGTQQNGNLQQSDSFLTSYHEMPPQHEPAAEFGHQPTKLSCKVLFARYFFTGLIFLLVLVSTALSKVCFANIAAQLNNNSLVGSKAEVKRRSVAFIQLVLVLCVPQAVTILKTLFLGILGKTTKHFPWPTWRALIKVCSLFMRVTGSLNCRFLCVRD